MVTLLNVVWRKLFTYLNFLDRLEWAKVFKSKLKSNFCRCLPKAMSFETFLENKNYYVRLCFSISKETSSLPIAENMG